MSTFKIIEEARYTFPLLATPDPPGVVCAVRNGSLIEHSADGIEVDSDLQTKSNEIAHLALMNNFDETLCIIDIDGNNDVKINVIDILSCEDYNFRGRSMQNRSLGNRSLKVNYLLPVVAFNDNELMSYKKRMSNRGEKSILIRSLWRDKVFIRLKIGDAES